MTHFPSRMGLGTAYDAFLFAAIPDDGGAAPLNTVSILARLDMDPWQEAAELARLSRDSAVQRLAALLDGTPGRRRGLPDAEMIALRLVALLPSPDSGNDTIYARTTEPGRAFDPTFVAIGFGFAVVVLVSGFFQAADIQAALKGAKPGARAPASSHPDIRH